MKIPSDGNVTGFVTAGAVSVTTADCPVSVKVSDCAGMEVVRES